MHLFLYTFAYKGFTVEYRIMARSLRVANAIAEARDRAWRAAIDLGAAQGCAGAPQPSTSLKPPHHEELLAWS